MSGRLIASSRFDDAGSVELLHPAFGQFSEPAINVSLQRAELLQLQGALVFQSRSASRITSLLAA